MNEQKLKIVTRTGMWLAAIAGSIYGLLLTITGYLLDWGPGGSMQGTFVRLNNDSSMACFCLTDPVIKGYRCAGSDYTGFWMGGGGIFFYPNDALKRFQPVDTVEIQGVVCKRSSVRGGVTLYENGNLKRCTAAREQTIDEVLCKENFALKFDENGILTYAKKEKIFD